MASRDQLNETVLHLQMCEVYVQAATTGQFMQGIPCQKTAGLYGHAPWSCEVIQVAGFPGDNTILVKDL